MGREIKFRAWDNKKNKFIVGLGLTIESMSRDAGDTFALSQYIGLKDKNGKEIYYSDFVKHEGKIWQIEWMWCGFVLMEPRNALNVIVLASKPEKTWSELLEVIGNIYENKELLDAKSSGNPKTEDNPQV